LEGTAEHNLDELHTLIKRGNTVTLFCYNEASRSRCREVLLEAGRGIAPKVTLELGRIESGFHLPELQWAALSDHEIFKRYKKVRRLKSKVSGGAPIRDFTELKTGDHVVHLAHGIGRFLGMERLKQQGQEQDYLCLLFADEAKLYVPLSHIDLVQKYIGGAEGSVTLSKLGGKTWSKKKARAAGAIREAAADLMRLQAVRNASPGIAFPADTDWQEQFEGEFIYQETEDQLAAIQSIKEDMEKSAPMDRLLCGDVGFGKTEIAIRAAFKAVMSGHQVAVLVPTTVLAEQHYRTFHERTADFPVRVECLSRFRTGGIARKIIAETKAGEVDIVIGTHRLLSKDVTFKDLGLVVIDEEQRFGVEHKERLKAMRAEVDVLTMTATPIPRTLTSSAGPSFESWLGADRSSLCTTAFITLSVRRCSWPSWCRRPELASATDR
jgi:transcription-repair coupling factor (superfamily II helicase)